MISNKLTSTLIIITIIALSIVSYANGLTGGYVLDDIPNLININVFSRFEGIEAFIRYILSYDAGPLKRPISTLSFLLNSTSLTVNAFYFKITNILLHILNALLLYLVTVKILKHFSYTKNQVQYIALSSMAIWLLHPFFVSTTLYIIQRMAMLPVFFVLLGIYFYLKSRELPNAQNRLKLFYLIISVYLCTLLATLSKENGIILPFYILLVEFFIIKNTHSTKLIRTHKFIIYFPIIIISLALIYKVPNFLEGYNYRDFSLYERLITESRVIVNYLSHLFIPRYISPGVYTDGFIISTSLFSPISTILSILVISTILLITFYVRKKHSLISFGIYFYFVGHIIESTFIPLEIYFEHRNYLPALFIFLSIPILLLKFFRKFNLNIFIMIFLSIYLANTTYKKSLLWSDTTKLLLHSSMNTPKSIRAIEDKAKYHYQNKNTHLAIHLLEKSIKNHSRLSLKANLLNLKCFEGSATPQDFDLLNKHIINNSYYVYDAESIAGLLYILIFDSCLKNDHEVASTLINNIKQQPNIKISKISKEISSLEIYLDIEKKNYSFIIQNISQYLYEYQDFNDVINMINKLINNNQHQKSIQLLNILEIELRKKKNKYVDRDYFQTISLIRNKLE